MIDRDKISISVKKVVEKNRLEKAFLPIIEEFFFRAADQYNWNNYDLEVAIYRFEKVFNIKFKNFEKKLNEGDHTDIDGDNISIFLNMEFLIGILKFKKTKINDFIETFMHELGHVIQSKWTYGYIYRKKEDSFRSGFFKAYIKSEENSKDIFYEKGRMVNEYAEIINAFRLKNGYISSNKYKYYKPIQSAGKIMLSSLGINEMKFSNLQLKGEEADEEFVKTILGKTMDRLTVSLYIRGFEETLDHIGRICLDKRNRRKDLILLVEDLQSFSNRFFKYRLEGINLKDKSCFTYLSNIIIDKIERDKALKEMFYEFNITNDELKIDKGIDIYDKLLEQGQDKEFLSELKEKVIEEQLKIKEETSKQNEKKYDNEELIEKIYQSFLRYPTKNLKVKQKVRLFLVKKIGWIKRTYLNKPDKLLIEGISYKDAHTNFASKVSNLEEYNSLIDREESRLRVSKDEMENGSINSESYR